MDLFCVQSSKNLFSFRTQIIRKIKIMATVLAYNDSMSSTMGSTTDTPLEGSCQSANGEKRAFHRASQQHHVPLPFHSVPFMQEHRGCRARFRNQFLAAMIANVRINEISDGRLANRKLGTCGFSFREKIDRRCR